MITNRGHVEYFAKLALTMALFSQRIIRFQQDNFVKASRTSSRKDWTVPQDLTNGHRDLRDLQLILGLVRLHARKERWIA